MMGLIAQKRCPFGDLSVFLMCGTALFHVVVATTTLWHSDAAITGPFRTSIELPLHRKARIWWQRTARKQFGKTFVSFIDNEIASMRGA
jgi:hypothetical protein